MRGASSGTRNVYVVILKSYVTSHWPWHSTYNGDNKLVVDGSGIVIHMNVLIHCAGHGLTVNNNDQ
jgi:hypothetical protein